VLAGQEQVPQPLGPGGVLELLDHRRDRPRLRLALEVAQQVVLDRVDALGDEAAHLLDQLLRARRVGEVHGRLPVGDERGAP
jgi:hypothetical protein